MNIIEKKQFYIINKNADSVEIYMYGCIGDSAEMPTADLVRSIKELSATKKDVKLRINSGSGSVYDGFAIIQALKECPNVSAYIDGIAASMAAIIAMSVENCYMSIYAKLMFHKPANYAGGNANDLREAAALCDTAEKDLCDVLVKKTGMTAEEVTAKFLNGTDQWFTASQALEMGIITGTYDGTKIDIPTAIKNEKALIGIVAAQLSAYAPANSVHVPANNRKENMPYVQFLSDSWDSLDRSGKLAQLKSKNPALYAAKFKSKFGKYPMSNDQYGKPIPFVFDKGLAEQYLTRF